MFVIESDNTLLYSVQITEAASFSNGRNVIDGPYPGRPEVKVGFNTTPTFGPSADFWTRIGADGEPFVEALDYVGLDFFPDAHVPIHIAEHGRPTSAGRTPDRQAEVIERVVRTVHANRGRLNIDPGAWGLTKILLTFASSSPTIIQQHQNHLTENPNENHRSFTP